MNTVIQLRPSRSEKPTVRGGRAKNADYRQREYLTESEIDKLVAAAGDSRNPVRDRLLISWPSGMRCGLASWWTFAGSKSPLFSAQLSILHASSRGRAFVPRKCPKAYQAALKNRRKHFVIDGEAVIFAQRP